MCGRCAPISPPALGAGAPSIAARRSSAGSCSSSSRSSSAAPSARQHAVAGRLGQRRVAARGPRDRGRRLPRLRGGAGPRPGAGTRSAAIRLRARPSATSWRGSAGVPHVFDVQSPLAIGNPGQISADGRSALVTFKLAGDDDLAQERVDATLAATAAAQRAHPTVRVEQFGEASANKAIMESVTRDFQKAEITSVPVTLVILLIAFGSLVAAGIPLLLGLTAVIAALGLLGPISHVVPVGDLVAPVVLLIGLAVGVDYSLFYLRRKLEERDRGRSERRGAADRRRDVRARGADLRHDRDRRDVRHADGRQRRLHVVRDRDDHGGRGRDARLGHRAAGDPRCARRSRRVGPRPVHRAAPPPRRLARVGRGARPRAPPARALAGARGRRAGGAGAAGARDAHDQPGRLGLPRNLPIVRTYDRIQAAFPGGPMPAIVVVHAR